MTRPPTWQPQPPPTVWTNTPENRAEIKLTSQYRRSCSLSWSMFERNARMWLQRHEIRYSVPEDIRKGRL